MKKHIQYSESQRLSSYRKVAIASWRHPRDPNTYCPAELRYDAAARFLEESQTLPAPTLTHYTAKILAHCLEQYPQLNHVIRNGRLQRRPQVDLFISTLIRSSEGKDLTGFLLKDVTGQSLADVSQNSQVAAEKLRLSEDEALTRAQKFAEKTPVSILRILMAVQDFFQYTLNLSLARFGLPDDPFGSAMVTNVGGLGFDNAFVPLSPYTRCPLLVCIGRPRQAPVVEDGNIVPGTVVSITFTFDHRYADGAHGAPFFRRFKKVFENPEKYRHLFEGSG